MSMDQVKKSNLEKTRPGNRYTANKAAVELQFMERREDDGKSRSPEIEGEYIRRK